MPIEENMARHKQMRNYAFDLRLQALNSFLEKDFAGVKKFAQEFLEVIRTLPHDSIDLFCTQIEAFFCGDMVVLSAEIFELLYFAYLEEDRYLEGLACLQKANKIISNYYPDNPEMAGKWEEYASLLTKLNNIYSDVSQRLPEHISQAQEVNFLAENLSINEEIVKTAYPKVNNDNFIKLQNYNPYLFQKILGTGSSDTDSSSNSSCFIATVAYSSAYHPDLDTFRQFRDEKLLTNKLGKLLVQLYYKFAPQAANWISQQPVLKALIQQQLQKLAAYLRKIDYQ